MPLRTVNSKAEPRPRTTVRYGRVVGRLLMFALTMGLMWVGYQRLIVAPHFAEALFSATRRGDQAAVRSLLARGADPNVIFRSEGLSGWLRTRSATPIHAAVRNGDMAMVRLLLDSGADPNGKDGFDAPALRRAAGLGERDIVEFLLDRGADVNRGDYFGGTALMSAAAGGHVDVVKLLLARGARVSGEDRSSHETALTYGARRADSPHREIVRLLIQAGATASTDWALGYVVENRDADTARLLLHHGGDPNGITKGFIQLLIWSAGHGDRKTATVLIEQGADVNFRDGSGDTALSVARARGDVAMVELLTRAGARQ